MDLTPSAFDGLRDRASRLAKRFSELNEAPDTISLFHRALLRFPQGELPSLSDRDHFFRSWYRAMRSVIADLYRTQQRRPIRSLDQCAEGEGEPRNSDVAATAFGDSPDKPAEDREFVEAVDLALARLVEMDPVAAKIVHLRYVDEKEWQSIASELGLSYGAVQRKWSAAKSWLRVELKRRIPGIAESDGQAGD